MSSYPGDERFAAEQQARRARDAGGAGDDAQASDVVTKLRDAHVTAYAAAGISTKRDTSDAYAELGELLGQADDEIVALRTQVAEQQAEIARLNDDCETLGANLHEANVMLNKAAADVAKAEQERDKEKAWADLVARGKSPLCGHWKVLAHTEDGGKRIDCYACEAERYRQERDTARAALVAVLDNARYGFRGTPYRESLDGAMRLLGYHCSDCGAVYKSNEIHDHATKTCKGQWIAALQSSAPASDEKTS